MFNRKNFFKLGNYVHKFGQGGTLNQDSEGNNSENDIPSENKEADVTTTMAEKFQIYDEGDLSTDCGGF